VGVRLRIGKTEMAKRTFCCIVSRNGYMQRGEDTMRNLTLVLVIAGFLASSGRALAQEPAEETQGIMLPQALEERSSQTRHSIRIDGRVVNYTATAGTYVLKEDDGKQLASIFHIAYMKEGVDDYSKRPLLFSFNGGPGTASVWLHMGVLGPRRVVADEEGFALQPPYRIVDNEYSILDVADVVFIDPVATGYSRMAPGEDPHAYHGTMEDIESVAEFIRLWTSRNRRWESPKFLIGESYGTVRASGLAGYLQEEHLMFLNGVILVSTTELDMDIGSDLNYALILPHYTATAWYHDALTADLQSRPLRDVLDEVEEFALNEYLLALAKGGYLPADEKEVVVQKLSWYTGLSPEYIRHSNLRMDRGRFRKLNLHLPGVANRIHSAFAQESQGRTVLR